MFRFGELEPLQNSIRDGGSYYDRDRDRLDTTVVEIIASEAGADKTTILVIGTTATMIAVAQQFNTMGDVVNERDILEPKAW